jgi:hypothetical protein
MKKTIGRKPLPVGEKKQRVIIYLKPAEIKKLGGEDATKQLLHDTVNLKVYAKKNNTLC